ncbi:MAG: hypothetical protein FWE45_03910 [Firmicutes bacterium]|nr:hypothetical protein [Bacillota bacterium]
MNSKKLSLAVLVVLVVVSSSLFLTGCEWRLLTRMLNRTPVLTLDGYTLSWTGWANNTFTIERRVYQDDELVCEMTTGGPRTSGFTTRSLMRVEINNETYFPDQPEGKHVFRVRQTGRTNRGEPVVSGWSNTVQIIIL